MWLCKSDVMSDVMSRDDKGRHYGMQNDRKNWGKMGGFVTLWKTTALQGQEKTTPH
jgi:hypothetical protein